MVDEQVSGNGLDQGAEVSGGSDLGALARQHYGSLFHEPPSGSSASDASEASQDEEAAAAASSGEAAAEATEDAPGVSGDGADEDAAAEAVEGQGDAEASEGFRSLSELFEAADLDMDAARSLPVRVKVDGKESEVPLSDVLDSYQMSTAAEQRLAEAKEKAKALNQELTSKREAFETNLVQTAELVKKAESLLDDDVKSINWSKLREDDPAEYSAKKQEISERRAEIEAMKKEALSSYQKTAEEQRQEAIKQHQERLAQEHAALLENLPEWRDEAKARAEKERLASYLIGQGFTQQDVSGAADHRLVLLARKAMLYDESRAAAGRKKVAKPGRVLRPGTPPSREQQNQEKVKRAQADHRKSGTIDSALHVLRAKRGGTRDSADRNVRNQ